MSNQGGWVSLGELERGTNLGRLRFSNLISERARTNRSSCISIYLPGRDARIRLNIKMRLVSRRGFDGN